VIRALQDAGSAVVVTVTTPAEAEMAAAAGTGCVLEASDPAELFTELPSRFVVATPGPDELCARADAAGIPVAVLGRAGGDRVRLGGLVDLPVEAVEAAEEQNLALALGDA
jgi:phosphoribosylformylglycinamidine synthase